MHTQGAVTGLLSLLGMPTLGRGMTSSSHILDRVLKVPTILNIMVIASVKFVVVSAIPVFALDRWIGWWSDWNHFALGMKPFVGSNEI